jgi:site-specific DNA-methyltransferase (adenine-specific)
MEYLCKLVRMPKYNLILDPFVGSGTTLLACIRLGIPCIGIDNDEKSCEIAAKRCSQEVMELQI